ncbi:cryptochrome-1 [Danaus plexippus]|uniref:Cryptochrome-1 n=2 Tax=Danaus plexippus TaxID=13037 RepID=A0A212EI23_DANPL|nr:cryptochrome-1 [Danaus plexippus]XP_061377232.1 cryptochrome-1 [Danaus plexippus]AAX58599.1 cryptochrome [Danaus plexippus]OWR41136.1 cryptochrome [Danaus plexippus plexippus]
MLGGNVIWFRHGLRLHDNPSLHSALEDASSPFFPIFIFDGETAGTKMVGYNRMRYLLEALNDLDQQFRKYGGKLLMIKGRPDLIFRRLWEEFGIRTLCFEQDCEPIWRPRDASVRALCRDIGVSCREHVAHTLWNPDTVIKANGGIPPLTYQMFLHTVEIIGNPPRPVDDVDLNGVNFGSLPESFYREFVVFDKAPKPEDLGVFLENEDIRMIRWVGGETAALKQMQERLAVEYETFCRGSYLPTHGNPDLLGPPISLSPALRFGCLSVRRFYWSLQDLFQQVHQGRLASTQFITGQLIWREYFYTMSVNNPNYAQMSGNPICLDIPWKEPENDELQRWKEGRTGFPFVDAAMRQLRTEGWLHHVVRNTVASFLTRGTLWLSWEHGLQHFLKYLLDADWSVCAGNWMWVSSSAFEALLDSGECACPVRLGRRLEPTGHYVRRYVPELARMPGEYIYEPWRAPLEVQEAAGCVIGRDYPAPVVDHTAAAARNRANMQELRRLLEKAPPHCCPSSEDEVRQFMWLGDDSQPELTTT